MHPIFQLLTNPAIISLAIGFVAGVYSLLYVPPFISSIISLYLVFAIGLKGGMCLGITATYMSPLMMLAGIGCIIGFIQPFIYLYIVRRVTPLDQHTATVIASQYGSISIVTFVTAITFLEQRMVGYDSFMSAVAGIMEIPAILAGLLLLKRGTLHGTGLVRAVLHTLYDIIASPKINVIFIGFFVGFLFRNYQAYAIPQTLLAPFTLILVVFMIDIGIKIAQQRHYIHEFTWSLIAFGIYAPLLGAAIGLLCSYVLGIDAGSALLFAMLVGSASYIAVPAIMSAQAPDAKEVIYLPLALGITLPFNLIVGIPLVYYLSMYLFV